MRTKILSTLVACAVIAGVIMLFRPVDAPCHADDMPESGALWP